MEVKLLTRIAMSDLRSNMGRNVKHIEAETNIDPLVASKLQIREALCRSVVPEEDSWKLPLLSRLLEERSTRKDDDAEQEDIDNLIEVVCTSTFS